MDESMMTQNRRSRRSNVLLAASIEALGEVIPVKLRNLSTEGALIEGKNLPVEGSEVVFRRNELTVDSRIAWVLGNNAGVAFAGPIAREDVLRNIPAPRSQPSIKFARPGLAHRELTPEERSLVRTWACGSGSALGD
ncbi:MAG: PilZ domain-containing protein [Sphingomonas sp.]|nr:PilZ domain-containing protein [Sphingomonas sp.]